MAVDQQCGSIRWSSCPLGKHSRQAFCAQHLDILQRARHDVTEGNVWMIPVCNSCMACIMTETSDCMFGVQYIDIMESARKRPQVRLSSGV